MSGVALTMYGGPVGAPPVEDFEYADMAAVDAALPEGGSMAGSDLITWSLDTTNVDSGSKCLKLDGASMGGDCYRTLTLAGLTPGGRYLLQLRCWEDIEGLGGIVIGVRAGSEASYYETAAGVTSPTAVPVAKWVTLQVPAVADGSGVVTAQLGFWDGSIFQSRVIRFDAARLLTGTDIPVAPGSEKMQWIPIEFRKVMFDGSMRATIIGYKRQWTLRTPAMTRAESEALRAAVLARPRVVIGGTWVEDSGDSVVTVVPTVGKEEPVAKRNEHRVTRALTFDEA